MDKKLEELLLQLVPLLVTALKSDTQVSAASVPEHVDETVGNTPGSMPMTTYTGPLVAVRATGVKAHETRYWPVPHPKMSWFSYLMNCSSWKRADGLPFIPAQYRAQISTIISSAGYQKSFGPEEFPWRADCFAYPEEWRTQEQIDQTLRDENGWIETNKRMQGYRSDSDDAVGGSV